MDYVLKEADGFAIDPGHLTHFLEDEMPDTVFICNPNNPTGRVYSRDFITNLIKASPPEIAFFIDESFIQFSDEDDLTLLIGETEGAIFLLRSLTKFYGLPGLRIGYGLGTESIITRMKLYKEPWTINTLALIAASLVSREKEYAERTKEKVDAERQSVYDELCGMRSLTVYPSGANFHLCCLQRNNALALQAFLEERGIFIRTCEDYTGLDDTIFRIAVKKKEDKRRLIKSLKEWEDTTWEVLY